MWHWDPSGNSCHPWPHTSVTSHLFIKRNISEKHKISFDSFRFSWPKEIMLMSLIKDFTRLALNTRDTLQRVRYRRTKSWISPQGYVPVIWPIVIVGIKSLCISVRQKESEANSRLISETKSTTWGYITLNITYTYLNSPPHQLRAGGFFLHRETSPKQFPKTGSFSPRPEVCSNIVYFCFGFTAVPILAVSSTKNEFWEAARFI